MSTMPSVINRFVEYYAGLDNQPSSALAALYEADATLIDPFGEHRGFTPSSVTSPIFWPTWSTVAFPSIRRCATATFCRDLDHALVAPAY